MTQEQEHLGAWNIDGHRREVVRRLLERGMSPHTLHLLLPELRDAIAGEVEPAT